MTAHLSRSLPLRPPLVCIAEARDALESAASWVSRYELAWMQSAKEYPRAKARAALVLAGAAVAEALAALEPVAVGASGPEADE